MKSKFWVIFLIGSGLLFLNIVAHSQIRESGVIQGNVTDLEGTLLPGVTITIESPSLIGGAHSRITDAKGFYQFYSLSIGVYKATADLPGFNTLVKEGIRLHGNMTLTIDFKMTQAPITKEVMVEAANPTIDIKRNKVATILMTDEFLTSVPSAKTFSGLLNFIPGISLTTLYGNAYNSSYGGGAGGQNAYLIDGIEVSSSSYDGYLNASPDMNIIQEASTEGLGLPAEFGNYTGTVLSAITKSGSNKLSTFNEFRYNGRQWNSQNLSKIPAERFSNPADKEQEFQAGSYFDVGLQLGGKIIQDRLWFFVAGEYDRKKAYPIGFPDVQRSVDTRIFTKFTYLLTPSNTLNVSANYDKEAIYNFWGRSTYSPEADANRIRPGWVFNSSWASTISPNTLLELKLGYNKKNQGDNVPKQGEDVPGHFDIFTNKHTVNASYFGRNRDEDYHGNAHLSHYASDFLKGSHDFKFGVEYTHSSPSSVYGYCGGKYYIDYAGAPYLLYTQDRPVDVSHKHSNISLFAQDSWTLTKRLTFNFGLRYEHYWYKIPTTGRGVVYNRGSLSPRIGFALDLLGDQKTVLKIHYGHYFDKLRQSYFYSADTGTVTSSYYLWTGNEWSELYSVTPNPFIYEIDPDIKHPFIREFTVGVDRELFKNTSLNISFYYRKMARFFGLVNTAARWQKVTIINPGNDGLEGTADDMGPLDVYERLNPGEDTYLITNPRKGQAESMIDDLKHTAKGIQITFNKRFSNRWQLNASYHYTYVLGNTTDINVGGGSTPNYFVNAYGHIGYFYGYPHQFKLQGAVLLPLDVKLGISAEYTSGENMQPYVSMLLGSSRESFAIEPIGKTKYDSRKNLDLRLEKVFNLEKVKLTVMADVFNVFNSDRIVYATRRAGPSFNKLIFVTSPRSFRLGFRIIM